MFVVDTNILIAAAVEETSQHSKARALVEKWRAESTIWHCTWGIFYEFLRVTTHRGIFGRPLKSKEAWTFLSTILDSPGFSLLIETEMHSAHLSEVIKSTDPLSGNLLHDAHIVVLMKEHGIREIYTADTDFHRFKGIAVVNPF